MKIFKLFFFISLIISLVSCSKEEPLNVDITSSTVLVTNLPGGENSLTEMKIDTGAQFLIIRNQTEYNNFVIGTCHPAIDFTSYQLVICQFPSGVKINSFKHKLFNSREIGFYKLYISPNYDNLPASKDTYRYYFGILVPSNEAIEFLRLTYSST